MNLQVVRVHQIRRDLQELVRSDMLEDDQVDRIISADRILRQVEETLMIKSFVKLIQEYYRNWVSSTQATLSLEEWLIENADMRRIIEQKYGLLSGHAAVKWREIENKVRGTFPDLQRFSDQFATALANRPDATESGLIVQPGEGNILLKFSKKNP